MSHRLRTSRLSRLLLGPTLVGLTTASCVGDDVGSMTDATSETTTDTTGEGTTGESSETDPTTGGTGGTDTTEGTETTGGTDTTDTTTYYIRGVITRRDRVPLPEGSDGIGTLNVGVVKDCVLPPVPLGWSGLYDTDLSDPVTEVPYIYPVKPGTHYVMTYFDDNENDLWDAGDLASLDGMKLDCREVVVTDADVEGVDFELNFAI